MKKILVTGGAGYIGAHVIRELIKQGYDDITVIDEKLDTSPNDVRSLVKEAHNYDILSADGIALMCANDFDAIIHLAAYISVEESIRNPSKYLRNNLLSTYEVINTVETINAWFGIMPHLIFASTGAAFCPENAYAHSKLACEDEITSRLSHNPSYTIFRFYNVSGVDDGISPTGEATHIIRRAAMAAAGKLPHLSIMGDDWDTPDGTAVRDYIHVKDLATAIVKAVEVGPANTPYECLGSGNGYSVLDVVTSMKRVTGVDFRVIMEGRRAGDVGSMICPAQYKHLKINHDLDSMCLSAFNGLK